MVSFRDQEWIQPYAPLTQLDALITAGLDPILARILAPRGVEPKDVKNFLNPTIKALLPNPNQFLDMDKALDRLMQAIERKESVWIWGDYDVDGACSTALLLRTLRSLGISVQFRIPDRCTEGYGPNSQGMDDIRQSGADLLVVVDAGTVAHDPLIHAQAIGLDVVVIDHHTAHPELPPAVAIVNPNRLDQQPGLGHLCAAGVVFCVCVGLMSRLRALGRQNLPDLMGWLDIVALATVADVVPLRGINRAFVRRGVERMETSPAIGIRALLDVSGIHQPPFDAKRVCGFALGPRINAGGRIADPSLGTQLLVTDNPETAKALAKRLDAVNTDRKHIQKICEAEALDLVDSSDAVIVVSNPDWHEGVVGIVAGRLKERFRRPAFVFGGGLNGVLKGSGRSVPGFDLGGAVAQATRNGVLEKGGGHPMAAGATVDPKNLAAFRAHMIQATEGSAYVRDGVPIEVDIIIPAGMVQTRTIDLFAALKPFGQANETPRVMVPNVVVDRLVWRGADLKAQTLNVDLRDEKTGNCFKAVVFRATATPLAQHLQAHVGKSIDVLGELVVNTWRHQVSVEMYLEDARQAHPLDQRDPYYPPMDTDGGWVSPF